ncbi:oxidoreductase [Zopfia rhizophila CBS 207.26]|uniref:Oxidoreductase n=1 Tax=Zopfia rhizophila CBS 207.26 TaxID=1314779 RepID=A0A6A6DBM1_9PEZI|nr:oxidoreductase [Zopfia rhizophila CBS 207.26]
MALVKTLNFDLFTKGSKQQREELGAALAEGFLNQGFVKLINHGIREDVVESVFKITKQFFALPTDVKAKIAHTPGPNPQRGWSRKGAETTAKIHTGNLNGSTDELMLEQAQEHFDCGPRDDQEYPNLWPDEDMPEFRPFMEQYFDTCHKVSIQIMEALEIGLKLPMGALVDRCTPAHSELRILHYPPVRIQTLMNGKTKRVWPHTDFGIITLLFQDSVGGLELEDRSKPGTFTPIVAQPKGQPSELVINTSETLQRLTNDYIRAGLHQVNIPTTSKGMTEGTLATRYSCAFFKASRETNVSPLHQFVTEDHPTLYKDMTPLEFNKERNKIVF